MYEAMREVDRWISGSADFVLASRRRSIGEIDDLDR
jgi:hypothetical protein